MRCPKCGSENRPGALLCSKCDTELIPPSRRLGERERDPQARGCLISLAVAGGLLVALIFLSQASFAQAWLSHLTGGLNWGGSGAGAPAAPASGAPAQTSPSPGRTDPPSSPAESASPGAETAPPSPSASPGVTGTPRIAAVLEIIAGPVSSADGVTLRIEGAVRSNATKTYAYVRLVFGVFDRAGARTATALASTTDFEPGQEWSFVASCPDPGEGGTFVLEDLTGISKQ